MKRFVRPSKAVTDGQKIAAALEAASFEIAPDVGEALEAVFARWVEEGETPPAREAYRQSLLGRWLRWVRERLVVADEAHQEEIRVERRLRRLRDDAAAAIEQKVRAVRTTFEKVYGSGLTAEVVGLASDIPEDPVVLRRYAERIIRIMADPDLDLPAPRVKGSTMGPEDVIGEIQPPLERLGEALDQIEPQKRRSQLALQEKREALAEFNYASGRIARYLEALCYLAGKDFHAERVRQSSHVQELEPDETFESDEEEESESDEESDEEEPAAGPATGS